MKKILVIVGLAALLAASAAQAQEDYLSAFASPAVLTNGVGPLGYLINWKVGDSANYNVTISQLPIPGTMVQSVTKDEGDGTLWFNETIDLVIQKQSVDAQIDKTNGKILKELVNGQEQTVDNTPPKVISQEYTSVTVPAGTFKAIHIVATTTSQGQDVQMEEWANPKDVCMAGSIKVIETTQGQTITMELTSFKKN
jgi:hypothetical protein